MIVVEALPAGEPGEDDGIVRGVVIVPAAPPVAECVDQRRDDEDVQHSVRQSGEESGPQAHDHAECGGSDGEPEETAREEDAIETVRREIGRVLGDGGAVPARRDVVVDVEELDLPEAEQARTVRIAFAVRERMVLTVDRHPFLPRLSRRQPQDRAECDARDGMDGEGPVRERPVQIDRGQEDRGLSQRDCDTDDQ